jgi:hypothetical protein
MLMVFGYMGILFTDFVDIQVSIKVGYLFIIGTFTSIFVNLAVIAVPGVHKLRLWWLRRKMR